MAVPACSSFCSSSHLPFSYLSHLQWTRCIAVVQATDEAYLRLFSCVTNSGFQNIQVNVILGAFDTCPLRCYYLPSVLWLKYKVTTCITATSKLPRGINASNCVSFTPVKCRALLGKRCIPSYFNLILSHLFDHLCMGSFQKKLFVKAEQHMGFPVVTKSMCIV